MKELQQAMGPNSVVFGERPLDAMDGVMIRSLPQHELHIDVAHEEVFYTDSSGKLHAAGFFKDTGVVIDSINGPDTSDRLHPNELKRISQYTFGHVYNDVTTSEGMLKLPQFTGDNYNLFFYNCQVYANTVREELHLGFDVL